MPLLPSRISAHHPAIVNTECDIVHFQLHLSTYLLHLDIRIKLLTISSNLSDFDQEAFLR